MDDEFPTVCDELVLPCCLNGSALRVRAVPDDLRGILTKVGDLCFEGFLLIWLSDEVEVEAIFIGEGVEDIHTLDGIFASLLVAIDQINPARDVLSHVGRLHFLSDFRHENVRVLLAPLRENHVVDHHLLLGLAVVIVILVYVHFG